MQHDTEKYRRIFEGMSPEETKELNRLNDEEHQRQAEAFKAGYEKGICYLCNKSFKTCSGQPKVDTLFLQFSYSTGLISPLAV